MNTVRLIPVATSNGADQDNIVEVQVCNATLTWMNVCAINKDEVKIDINQICTCAGGKITDNHASNYIRHSRY